MKPTIIGAVAFFLALAASHAVLASIAGPTKHERSRSPTERSLDGDALREVKRQAQVLWTALVLRTYAEGPPPKTLSREGLVKIVEQYVGARFDAAAIDALEVRFEKTGYDESRGRPPSWVVSLNLVRDGAHVPVALSEVRGPEVFR